MTPHAPTSMHRYILQPYKGRASRFPCPQCNHKGRFTRYIDTHTNAYLGNHVGKCDRADNCGYHFTPREFFAGNPAAQTTNHEPPVMNHFDTLPRHFVTGSTKAYDRNNLIAFLANCFDEATALRLAEKYRIGTSKHWPGATIFWQIDVNDNVRTGKIMLYNPADGHRVKKPYNHITWAHVLSEKSKVESQKSDFTLKQCFFGEHLLNSDPFKTVAIAESEKTAVVCSFYYPEYIWLAAGSLEGLGFDKCRVLQNRYVVLYPDLNAYDKWKKRAHELNVNMPAAKFVVDYTLERSATDEERARGLDMADRWLDQLTK